MINAVLFDHDGVLMDTESVFFEVTREALAGAGVCLTPEHWARFYLGHGRSSRQIAEGLGLSQAQTEEVIQGRNRTFRERLKAGVSARPAVPESLEALRGRVRMAIVTGSPRAQLNLVHPTPQLLGFFDCIVASEDYQRPKPHPDAYLAAMERLGLAPRQCLAVEDSPRGVAAARAAGVRCVLIPTELTDIGMCHDADFIAADITGVVRLVRTGEI